MTWLRRLPLFGRLFGPKRAGPEHRAAVDELIERFRRFGLLTELKTEQFLQEFTREWRRPFDPGGRWDRAVLAHTDAKHVWMNDVEADVCAENRVYCEFLRSLATISEGTFDPQGIEESWQTDSGRSRWRSPSRQCGMNFTPPFATTGWTWTS